MVGDDVSVEVSVTLDVSDCDTLDVSVMVSDRVPLGEEVDDWLPVDITLELSVEVRLTLAEDIGDTVDDWVRVRVGDTLCVPDEN